MDRKHILSEYIRNEVIRNSNATLDEKEDLISGGVLDSLGILQLVAYINKSFDIEVPDEDVIYENFYSLEAIINYLEQYS